MSNSSLVSYTKLSPNCTKPRNHVIDTITIHCFVGQVTAKDGCNISSFVNYDPNNGTSCNYIVGKDGSIGLCVEEANRSWCSSNRSNDHRAITIEVASDTTHPYAVTGAAYSSLIDLLVDVCKRNGIKELKWRGDKSLIGQVDKQNMTVHRWFADKDCPGDWLYERHGKIAAEVNARLGATTGKGESMKTIVGSTASETKMIKAIQSAVGAIADGEIGTQTISDIACKLGADCFPLTVEIYGAPVIIANNIVPFAGKGQTLSGYNNVINGSFYAGGQPCSILVQDGIVKQKYACHASHGKPESVMYRLKNGTVGMARAHNTDELPDTVRGNIRWAVGGMGLLDNYNPTAEGFCKCTTNGVTQDFSDVRRDTNHSMLGYKNGYFYLVYCKSMTGVEVNAFAKKLGLTYALMLDGGHVAGINGAESFAKINTAEKQYYMIQGEKMK